MPHHRPLPRRVPRRPLPTLALALAAIAVAVPAAAPPASAASQPRSVLVRVSPQGYGSSVTTQGSLYTALSSTGRYVAYWDRGTAQSWIEDLTTGATELISRRPDGVQANNSTAPVAVSADGNRIAFMSTATNLGGGAAPPPGEWGLWVRDRKANTTKRADVVGAATTGVWDVQADMDDAGTEVAWIADDQSAWVRNLAYGSTTRVDVSTANVPAADGAIAMDLSGDGKHVALTTYSALAAGDSDGFLDTYVRNLTTKTTVRASLAQGGGELTNSVQGYEVAISDDGTRVGFSYAGKNVTPGDTNANIDVFVRDLAAGTTTIASRGVLGTIPNGDCQLAGLTGDGHQVLLHTKAANMTGNVDGNGTWDLFVHTLSNGGVNWVSRTAAGLAADQGVAGNAAISVEGNTVAYQSPATNLVPNDTNGKDDVFVRMTDAIGPFATFTDLAETVLPAFGFPGDDAAIYGPDLDAGRNRAAHLILTLAHDPSWSKDRGPVTRLYTSFFRREPDLGGLSYWVNKRKAGWTLSDIATRFAKSSEFQTKYGSVANSAFVTLVYQNVLDRNPDSAGLAHWVAKLQGGMSRGGVMVQFSESNEGKRHLAPEVDTVLVGLGLLGKLPSKADYATAVTGARDYGAGEVAVEILLNSTAYIDHITNP